MGEGCAIWNEVILIVLARLLNIIGLDRVLLGGILGMNGRLIIHCLLYIQTDVGHVLWVWGVLKLLEKYGNISDMSR